MPSAFSPRSRQEEGPTGKFGDIHMLHYPLRVLIADFDLLAPCFLHSPRKPGWNSPPSGHGGEHSAMHHIFIPHHLYTQAPPSQEEDSFDSLDRVKEILADGEHPFPIERKVLKELLQHKTDRDIQRIKFLSSGQLCHNMLPSALPLTRERLRILQEHFIRYTLNVIALSYSHLKLSIGIYRRI